MRSKRYYWLAGALFLIAVLAVGWLSINKTAKEEDAIHIRVKDIEGNTVNIDDEKPTVLFFMAAWCVSCAEIEQSLKEVAKDKNVQVVTVDVDPQIDKKEHLAAFQRTYGGSWPHVFDADLSLVKLFGVNSLDTVVVVKDEKVVHKSIRPNIQTIKEAIRHGR
ncbi:TlpA disulfide reductase family protein [Geobacillus sp. G4]